MITPRQLEWAAGFLEGEGSFLVNAKSCPSVNCSQVQLEPLEKLRTIIGGTMRYIDRSGHANYNPKHSNYYRLDLYGSKAAGVMMTLYSLMSPKRQEQIVKALDKWKAANSSPGDHYKYAKECKRGHAFTPENTYLKDGRYRQCRTCQKANARKWYLAQSNPT